jgi:ABC-type uncharacterized transport system substrate-binding protein
MLRCLAAMLLLLPLPAAAHPHVWIDATLSYVVADGRVTALDVTWLFDDFYSAMVQEDFDGDGDGVLSQQELDRLVGLSAVNLSQYSFFTHVKIGSRRLNIRAVKEFYAETTDEGLTLYRFRVLLPAPAEPKDIAVGLFDDSYYVDVWLPEETVQAPPGCRAVLEQDQNEPLYYGTYFPTYVHLVCGGG